MVPALDAILVAQKLFIGRSDFVHQVERIVLFKQSVDDLISGKLSENANLLSIHISCAIAVGLRQRFHFHDSGAIRK